MDKPFQTYDDTSDAATCAPRLAALRAELAKRGLDGFVVPHSDQHMGEYLPAYAERLAWLTAFTGSAPPVTPAKPHAFNRAGEQSEAKRLRLGDALKKAGVESCVVTLADSVCWLLNIRGHDVPHTPFPLPFAILNDDGGADLFLDPAKRSPELLAHLGNSVKVHEPSQFTIALDAMKGKSVLVDPSTAAAAIFDRLATAGARIKHGADPC